MYLHSPYIRNKQFLFKDFNQNQLYGVDDIEENRFQI